MLAIRIFLGFLLFWGGYHETNACTETGRFPNNAEPDCRGFTMCLKGAAGFMQYNLVCPEHSIYSHIDNQCTNVTEYKCWPSYNCSKEENVIDPTNDNCASYISCVEDLNNILSARLIECPINMVFNGTFCVSNDVYQCPQKTVTQTVDVSINNFTGNVTYKSAAVMTRTYLYYTILSFLCFVILK